ncbi:putative gag-pol polyprotein [Tanacetum coccineum]
MQAILLLELWTKKGKKFQPIHYASKTLSDAQTQYTTTEKELLAVVYAFEKFRSYLVLSKTIVSTDHSALKYLFAKKDAKPRLLRLENPHQGDLVGLEMNDNFPHESLNMISLNPDNEPSGHPSSVDVIMQGLEEFKNVFGLVPSILKSTAFFCNVPNALKTTILNSMPFAKGSLPIRYLGVPLISSRLLYRDCKILMEKLKSPRIIHDLEQLMRGFLWCQCELKKGRAKVAWDSVCKPKLEGGLGVAEATTNPAFDSSFYWNKINNGKLTSMWFDKWHDLCPIRDMLTVRDITRSGFGLDDSVSDCISNGHWRWPPDWLDRIPGLSSIPVPNLIVGYDDVRLWCDSQGNLKPFSVAYAWDSVRLRADVVDWYHLVWFPQCIPKHVFHLCFFEYLHYELPEDVVSIIFGIILELQHDDFLYEHFLDFYQQLFKASLLVICSI